MSVAALQPSAVIYREEQAFPWWVYAAVAAGELAGWLALSWLTRSAHDPAGNHAWRGELSLGLALGLALPAALAAVALHMTTEVTPTDLRVWFGWIPTYRRALPLSLIRSVSVVQVRPIADYGVLGCFLGPRVGRDGERAFLARGDRGVRIEMVDGTRYVIGSQRPEPLASAIRGAIRPDA